MGFQEPAQICFERILLGALVERCHCSKVYSLNGSKFLCTQDSGKQICEVNVSFPRGLSGISKTCGPILRVGKTRIINSWGRPTPLSWERPKP